MIEYFSFRVDLIQRSLLLWRVISISPVDDFGKALRIDALINGSLPTGLVINHMLVKFVFVFEEGRRAGGLPRACG
jgi:hypothetical protein